eukprot:gene7962-9459_t
MKSLRLYSITYALVRDAVLCEEESFLRDALQSFHKDDWEIRTIDKLHYQIVDCTPVTDLQTTAGIKLCADSEEIIQDLRKLDRHSLFTVDFTVSEKNVILHFMQQQNVRPYTWWNVVADTAMSVSDKHIILSSANTLYFTEHSCALPDTLRETIHICGVRLMIDTNHRSATVILKLFNNERLKENDLSKHHMETRYDMDSSLEKSRSMEIIVKFIQELRVSILLVDTSKTFMDELYERCYADVIDLKRVIKSKREIHLLSIDMGRAVKKSAGVINYVNMLGAYRRNISPGLTLLERFRSETSILFNVMQQRDQVVVELFTHRMVHKLLEPHLTLLLNENRIEGVLPLVRHAYRHYSQTASPPQFFVQKDLLTRTIQKAHVDTGSMQGGYNVPPFIGLHDTEVAAMDFRSFYPSCIISYNIGKGLVKMRSSDTGATSTPSEVLRPIHIGDKTSDICDCCKQSTFCSTTSSVLHEIQLGQRYMRIWQNLDDERAVQVRHTSDVQSTLGLMLRRMIKQREDMKQRRDAIGDLVCKTLCNSVFGMFGYQGRGQHANEFYDPACYTAIVQLGRSHLLRAAIALDRMNMSILYGDTDSLFVGKIPEGDIEHVLRSVNNDIRERELRSSLLSNDAEYCVDLQLAHRFSSILIFSKKKYIVKELGQASLKRVGFRRIPHNSEICEQIFIDFCVNFCFEWHKKNRDIVPNALHALNAFLVAFDEMPKQATWFFTVDSNNNAKFRQAITGEQMSLSTGVKVTTTKCIDMASIVWKIVDKEMRERLCPLLFVDTEWSKVNIVAQDMILNHFHSRYMRLQSQSERASRLSTLGIMQSLPACVACKRPEAVFDTNAPLQNTDAAKVIEKIQACTDFQCERWHVFADVEMNLPMFFF